MRVKQINWQIFPPVLYHCSPFMLEIFCGFPIQRHWWQGKHLGRWILLAPIGALLLIVSLVSLYATTCFKIFVRTEKRVVKENSQMLWCVCYFFQTHWKPTNLENWFPMLGKAAFCNIRLGLKCVSMLWEYTIPSPAPHFKINSLFNCYSSNVQPFCKHSFIVEVELFNISRL